MDEEGLEYKYNFQIKKEQIKEMIGFSMTGLVIIPDNIFTQAEKESDYKKIFMIINVPKKEPDSFNTIHRREIATRKTR